MTLAGAKYEYEQRLGGGGMAEVFRGRIVGAEGFSRQVAIKRVLPHYSQDPRFAAMFVDEGRLTARLVHPNVVQVFDFDRDAEGRLFLVMELVDGKDLDALMQSGMVPLPALVHVIGEVLQGLSFAHEMTTDDGKPLGIVHRDISPHNVLVSWDGGVKVSDFGIAKAMLASEAVMSGMIKGKPSYMAPEQVTTPDALDHRADLFACGVMLYEALTGRRVYQGMTNSELLTDVIQVAKGWRQLVPPTDLRPDLPADLAAVTMKLLAPDRAHRYASARDALDALRDTRAMTSRGAELVAQLMAERFPTEAPPRVTRRRPGNSGMIGPDGATWVVTPPPTTPPVMPSGTPTVDERPPKTLSLPLAAPPPTAAIAAAAPARRAWPAVVAIGVVVAVAAAAVALIAMRPGAKDAAVVPADAAPSAPAAETRASTAAPDAAPTVVVPVVPVVPDAGDAVTAAIPADAAPTPPTPAPTDGRGAKGRKDKGKGKGKGTGSGPSGIHEMTFGGGGK
jgi:eukaryotic-like serine/threonine-protein kinase